MEEKKTNLSLIVPGSGETVFYDVSLPPFKVHGLKLDGEGYYRLPHDVAAATSPSVEQLNLQTAGGRVRFRTDANRIVLKAEMREISKFSHFSLTGTAGFDLYAGGIYRGTFVPPWDVETGFTGELTLEGDGMREILIHFPLYAGVTRLELGFPPGSRLAPAPDYDVTLPTVYYGSSITQGGCASRPGNAYENMLSLWLSCEHVNLGFSGSAKGETAMAAYIAGLPMSAFVLDYDYNAPTPEHLEATHAPFFQTVRDKNPELPIFLLSRPQPVPTAEDLQRREIIRKTWETAVKNGDKNVTFVDGTEMLRLFGDDCGTVDNCHPNDLGFYCMAKTLAPLLKRALKK